MSRTNRLRRDPRQRVIERRAYGTRQPSPDRAARLKRAVREVFAEYACLNPDRWWVEADAVEPIGRPLKTIRAWITLHHLGGVLPDAVPGLDSHPLVIPRPMDDQTQDMLAEMLQEHLNATQPIELRLQAVHINRSR